jgi:RNA polymerase sigma factor (sigma-70 family)
MKKTWEEVLLVNKNEALSGEQKKMVSEHIDIVKWTIYDHIQVNENFYGLGYDDIFQEGCIWLCKAAATYNGNLAQFETYAQVVVKNGLLSYCKQVYGKQKHTVNMSGITPDSDDDITGIVDDAYESVLSDAAVFGLLESAKSKYTGVTRLGIEALELKVKGYTGAEISELWGVEQNHVGAWISRAKKKLRRNETFMAELQA